MAEYKIDVNRKTVKEKAAEVEEVKANIKNYKTIALIDLKKLPDALFQNIRKKIRESGGKTYVLRKPVISRVLQGISKLSSRAGEADKPIALLLTNQSPYELNKFFKQNKKKRAAKVGEVSPFEIIVPEGETDLAPGPALSELKSAGLNVQIKGGKIVVAKESKVAKAGDALNDVKVKALQQLGIKPFETAVSMIFAFDGDYIYSPAILNIDETLNSDLQSAFRQSFNLSINASYPTEQNITLLLQEAYRQSLNISINGNLYSSGSIGQLLSSALRQGLAVSNLNK